MQSQPKATSPERRITAYVRGNEPTRTSENVSNYTRGTPIWRSGADRVPDTKMEAEQPLSETSASTQHRPNKSI